MKTASLLCGESASEVAALAATDATRSYFKQNTRTPKGLLKSLLLLQLLLRGTLLT